MGVVPDKPYVATEERNCQGKADMSYCANCGKGVHADTKFCPNCGAEVALGATTTALLGSTQLPPLADLGSRVVAGLIDYIIIAVIAVVVAVVMFLPVFMINPYNVWMMSGFIMSHFGWFGGVFGPVPALASLLRLL